DTAMIYRKDLINPLVAEPIRLQFPETGIPSDFTRDILYVKFNLNELELHTFVLHLPSRQNVDVNRDFRNLIMRKLRERMDEILEEDPNAYIVIMRSEERRVGKECRSRWSAYHEKKNGRRRMERRQSAEQT